MILAFPGMGKTTLAAREKHIVDLSISDIKFDNSSVSHLTKEERKAVPRPIKDRQYRKTYLNLALQKEKEGYLVLLALHLVLPIFWLLAKGVIAEAAIYIPHPSLLREYQARFRSRGNNKLFINQVTFVWLTVLPFLWLASFFLPKLIYVLGAGQTLTDAYEARYDQFRYSQQAMKMCEN